MRSCGWFYTESADGQTRLDVVLSRQGNFIRHNPDGHGLQMAEPAMTVSVHEAKVGADVGQPVFP
jgi:hypothetical protein